VGKNFDKVWDYQNQTFRQVEAAEPKQEGSSNPSNEAQVVQKIAEFYKAMELAKKALMLSSEACNLNIESAQILIKAFK
jgi:uncharacterized coiled-coil DUF342 family protein